MVSNTYNEIKKCYVAYFDLLGYKEYLKNNPDNAIDFLNFINHGITNTINYIENINNSELIKGIANITIKTKVFSDNILLCMDVLDGDDEKYRLISFISIVAEIQRGFILQCGLFLRGGIVEGDISFNDDYVFGQGLVDAVDSEAKAVYPRIIVSKKLVELLSQNTSYTKEEAEKAISLEERSKKGEHINEEDIFFYQKMLSLANKELVCLKIAQNLLPCWNDGEFFVSYLYHFSARDFLDQATIKLILDNIYDVKLSESNKNELSKLILEDNTEKVLNEHKKQVTNELKKHGNYANLLIDEIKSAELREKILKKYVWVMAYHNDMCNRYQIKNSMIATHCNCDRRFMKMTIEVIDDEKRI